jgi:hypothetical protein
MNYLMPLKSLFLSFLFLLFFGQSFGQEIQTNAWNALFTDYSLSENETIRLETHYRTKDFYSLEDQYLIRPSYTRKINKNVSLSFGVTHLSTQKDNGAVKENNLWQQFGFSFPIKKFKYFGWIRLEERWQKKPLVATTDYGARVRFRTGFEYPLGGKDSTSSTSLLAFNEVFMFAKNGFPVSFNQNWTFIGFQKKISNSLRLITGYQRNTIQSGTGFVEKNIWSTLVFLKL